MCGRRAVFAQQASIDLATRLVESSGLLPEDLDGLRVAVIEPQRPERDPGYGARLQAFVGGWDLALHALDQLDPVPVLAGRITIESGRSPIDRPHALLTLRPVTQRRTLYGVSLSNAFGPVTLRGETAWTPGRLFPTLDPVAVDGLVEVSELSSVLGIDISGPAASLVSFQMFRSDLGSPLVRTSRSSEQGIPAVRDESESTATGLFLLPLGSADQHELRTLWVHGLERDDGWAQVRLKISATEAVDVLLEGDVFYGDPLGLFGQFDRRDRLELGVVWHW